MTYCTEQQARDAGATGSSGQVMAAVASAQQRIDRFTGELWEPTAALQVVADLHGGVALLPRQIDATVAPAVRVLGATSDLVASSYQVTSSRTPGGIDAVYLGAGGSDYLIAGAEPYNGGWANLQPRTGKLLVTGTFGTATTPVEVTRAAAMLAAAITLGGPTTEPDQVAVNVEGETLEVKPSERDSSAIDATPIRTTGLAAADALLAPLRKRPVRLTGV